MDSPVTPRLGCDICSEARTLVCHALATVTCQRRTSRPDSKEATLPSFCCTVASIPTTPPLNFHSSRQISPRLSTHLPPRTPPPCPPPPPPPPPPPSAHPSPLQHHHHPPPSPQQHRPRRPKKPTVHQSQTSSTSFKSEPPFPPPPRRAPFLHHHPPLGGVERVVQSSLIGSSQGHTHRAKDTGIALCSAAGRLAAMGESGGRGGRSGREGRGGGSV